MVQYLNEPQFPVIDEVPDTKTIMKGFRATDWRNMFLATVVSMPFGYSAGRPLLMRPTMYGSAGIGALFGFLLGWEKAHARIMGFRENADELKKFGIHASTTPTSATLAASTGDSPEKQQ